LEAAALISVIVPCYNQGSYLSDSLQSILNQSYQYWECIIVNDGSSDQTETIAQQWVAKDSRFYYLKKENGGLSSARNAGLKVAKGAFVQFLDADDTLGADKFRLSVEAGADIVVADFEMFITHNGQTTPPFCKLSEELLNYESVLAQWDISFNIPIHCGLFKSEVLKGFSFSETLKAKEDWLMWLYVFAQSSRSVFIPQALAFYRLHAASMTADQQHMNDNLEKVYKQLFGTLNEDGKKVLFDKMVGLYVTEMSRNPLPKGADPQDYLKVEKGARALGFVGQFLFRTLRKVGHWAGKKEQEAK
jgi:glycosyltransferase involved in cell wall biosynthesis